MILADTSIWVDHLRDVDPAMERHLDDGRILIHPFVIGEVALGNLTTREIIMVSFFTLPTAQVATDTEVLALIGAYRLYGQGVGYVDCCLLASARMTPNAQLWTRDRRLTAAAERLGVSFSG